MNFQIQSDTKKGITRSSTRKGLAQIQERQRTRYLTARYDDDTAYLPAYPSSSPKQEKVSSQEGGGAKNTATLLLSAKPEPGCRSAYALSLEQGTSSSHNTKTMSCRVLKIFCVCGALGRRIYPGCGCLNSAFECGVQKERSSNNVDRAEAKGNLPDAFRTVSRPYLMG